MSNRELPPDEIEELLKEKKDEVTYTIPGTQKKKRFNTSIRTVTNWFNLPHKSGYCTVPSHVEHRTEPEEKDYPRDRIAMVIELNGMMVCRWCFIERRDEEGL